MVMSQENNGGGSLEFDDGCFVEECPDKKLMVFDVFESDEGCEENIVDMLPNDPFGMDFNMSLPRDPFCMDFDIDATVPAGSASLEDFGLKDYSGFEDDDASEDEHTNGQKIFAELNFVWAGSMEYRHEEGENVGIDTSSMMHTDDGSYEGKNMLEGCEEKLMCFGSEKYHSEHMKDHNDGDGGAPADAMFFALSHLDVRDLLTIERVCKPFCDAVRDDPFLWQNFHIDYPLSDKITDDDLLRLTNRAQGTLSSLSLERCLKITNDGLRHVLERNPRLTKLSVPGCIKLRVEGVLHDLRVFNSVARPGIKYLRISELGLTNQHFKEFKLLLGVDEDRKASNYKPRFYRAGEIYLSLDDDRDIDIEICPMCHQARQVYDCPAQSCQEKIHSAKACRACIICIARCISCGCCLENKAYEETFSFDLHCFDCLAQLFKGQDRVTLSSGHSYFNQRANYHFLLYS